MESPLDKGFRKITGANKMKVNSDLRVSSNQGGQGIQEEKGGKKGEKNAGSPISDLRADLEMKE
jgi:hypothetical protein